MNIHKALKRIKELGGKFSQTEYQFSVEIPIGVCGMKKNVVFRAKRHVGHKRNPVTGYSSHPTCWCYTFWQTDWDWDTAFKGYLSKNKTDVLEHFIQVMESSEKRIQECKN